MKHLSKYELIRRFEKIQEKLEKRVVTTHYEFDKDRTMDNKEMYLKSVSELHEFLNSAKQQINLFRLIVKSNGWLAAIVFAALMIGGALGYLPILF